MGFSCLQHRLWPLSRGGSAPLAALLAPHGPGKGGSPERGSTEAAGGEEGAGFDGSSSAFHSLSRFNGRGDQSRDGVIHRDKPIPEEARRKQHCELCYPGSPSPGEAGAESAPGAGPAGFWDGHCPSVPESGRAGAELPTPSPGVPGDRSRLLGRDGLRCRVEFWGRPPHTRACESKGRKKEFFPRALAPGCSLQLPELPRWCWRPSPCGMSSSGAAPGLQIPP